MNKNKLLFFISLLMIASVTIWSCKDEFSAEEQLRLQAELDEQARQQARQDAKADGKEKDSIALSIQVYNASASAHSNGGRTSGMQGASGVAVKISAGGTIVSQTTTAEGIANFLVQPGVISGTVSGTGIATANFTITVSEAEDGEGTEPGEQITNASVVLPVFANTGANTAKVSGRVTFEGNLLNETQENVPDGTVVTFRPDPTSLQNYYVNIGSGPIGGEVVDIDAYSFEGTFTASTTNGGYSINLPAGANGLNYTFTFNEFSTDQSIAINNYLNNPAGSTRDIVTIRTNFGQSVGAPSAVPVVLPVQFDIQAPPVSGTGATVNLRLTPQNVLGLGNPAPVVLGKGTGYPASSATVPVTISGGDYDSTVPGAAVADLTANTNSLGQVVSINVNALGFGYRSRPTLTVGGGGTGAVIRINWTSPIVNESFPNGPSTVTAGGSGYLINNTPTILVTGFNFEGEVVSFSIDTSVASGSVVGIVPVGGQPISSITSAVVVSPLRAQATAGNIAGFYGLSSLGELINVIITNGGDGYADALAPSVTVRGLRGGTGAAVTATIDDHQVVTLSVVNRGSGYSGLTNANFPTAAAFTPSSTAIALIAGQERVLDTYYGTGRRSRDVQ